MTRKFSTKYSEDDIYDAFTLAQTLLNQIEYYIQNEKSCVLLYLKGYRKWK